MGTSDHSFDAVEASADAPRTAAARPFLFGWTILLLGAALAAAALALLMSRPPAAQADVHASNLAHSVLTLGWMAGAGDALPAARGAIDRELAVLRALRELDATTRERLTAFEQRWAVLRTVEPSPDSAPSLRELADEARAIAQALRRDEAARQTRRDLWLRGLTLALLATLVLPVVGLWRQRRALRRSLRRISCHLTQGDWQDAVSTLRETRTGVPSAFDALASGVEDAMAESERRWHALADLSADWYWETDRQHRLTQLSGTTPPLERLGLAIGDLVGRRYDQVGYFEEPAIGWAALHERMERHEAFRDVEFRLRSRRGEGSMWVAISGRPRLDARTGRFVGYEGIGRDITERRIAHERLAASEQRWSLMAGLASDWYWQTDAEHRLLPMSRELARRFGDSADRFVGKTRWEAHRGALSAEAWAAHRADLEAHKPFRGLQIEIEVEPGRFLWHSISGIPRFDAQGRFVGYHGVGRDVTARVEAQRVLMRHNDELQRAVGERTRELEQLNRDLEAFSRQLAHELRTPIGHVQGLAHLIGARAADRLTGEERQLLELQVGAARNMRETVDALLQLARSTVQPMPMAEVDVSALAQSVIAELEPLERRAAVAWSVAPGLRARASTGALRIVLANLLGNAAKFTRKVDAPVVSVSGRSEPDGRLRVIVEDNGAGFDGAQADRLFAPFSRLHAGDDYAGTGIGLTIVARIVERHGGSITATGEPGAGARFEFTLPGAGS